MVDTTRLRPARGRDPREPHRAATPLELLFDLTFAVAFSAAGGQFAHMIAAGHWAPALWAFGLAMFATAWAWINFTWLASAFDTDDWLFRLSTMVQMVGVLVFAVGLPAAFRSIEEGHHLDNRVMVLGYVIMRVGLIAHWLRVAATSPTYRRTALTYAVGLAVVQAGWVVVIVLHQTLVPAFLTMGVLAFFELAIPLLAERREPTPWHPHHIAERYSLLVIITLGECVIGTAATLTTSATEQGWTLETALMGLGGIALTFALWWVAFLLPWGEILALLPRMGFRFGYGHMLIFAALAAVGAGLHLAAYDLDGESHLGRLATALALVVPVAVFLAVLYALYSACFDYDLYHLGLGAATVAVLAAAVAMGAAGLPVPAILFTLVLAPVVTILGYEHHGRHHIARSLERRRLELPAL